MRPGAGRSSGGGLYFASAPVDWLAAGGASVLAYGALRFLSLPRGRVSAALLLLWVVNWPHFSATLYRLYRSRENIARYPLTAALVPALAALGAAGCFASPAVFAPLFIKMFLFWSPYHFSGQTVGVTLVYARRAGVRLEGWGRAALSGFVFGSFLLGTARAEVGPAPVSFYALRCPVLGLPPWVPGAIFWWMWACGAALLTWATLWSWRHRRLLPLILLLPSAAQMTWFVLGPSVASFYELVPMFHGLQYLLIAWAMQLGEAARARGAAPSAGFAAAETLRWGAGNLAGGALLFWALPRLASWAGQDLGFATPVVIAAVQIHHFFVDGVIWKLRDGRVGEVLAAGSGAALGAPAR